MMTTNLSRKIVSDYIVLLVVPCRKRAGHSSNHRLNTLGSAKHHSCTSKLSGPTEILNMARSQ